MNKIKVKNKKKIVTHEQWIEIRRVNGETVSTFYPPNDQFERERLEKDPVPDLIYRRLNFVHGVPREYRWTKPTPELELYGGMFLQRLKPEDWLTLHAGERKSGLPHANPGKGQPRPEEFGPCPCPRCTKKREEQYANPA
jgi:hypothetical protein